MSAPTTEALYDANATQWTRRERLMLSDFTARPVVLDELGPLDGAHVLDLGCGEGYVARLLAEAGAASVFGVDISTEMVRAARAAIPPGARCEMIFETGDAAALGPLPLARFERIAAVFLFNYLDRAAMTRVLVQARERLAPGGRLVFTVPHPCFPYMRSPAPPFYFDTEGQGYLTGVDRTYEGRIWRRDGTAVPVRCVHKTFGDYFTALAAAGLTTLPRVVELAVTDEHLALDPEFFGPLRGHPLHMLFRIDVP